MTPSRSTCALALLVAVVLTACATSAGDGAIDGGGLSPDAGFPPPDCGSLTACGALCVDLLTDPASCGACGRTCVVPNATASCVAGECTVGACDDGFFDTDGDPVNGCELLDECTDGASCTTGCGSSGVATCNEGVLTCVPPAEACNGADDDCNGACDEGAIAGCRVPVHRSYGNGHLFTTDLGAASTAPFRLEVAGYFHLYGDAVPGARPLFLCRKADGKHLLTSDTACETVGAYVATLGFISPAPICGAVPLHRLYHAPSNNHFYTLSEGERDNAVANLGYTSEGIYGYVWTAP
jgi:hypothetical protein